MLELKDLPLSESAASTPSAPISLRLPGAGLVGLVAPLQSAAQTLLSLACGRTKSRTGRVSWNGEPLDSWLAQNPSAAVWVTPLEAPKTESVRSILERELAADAPALPHGGKDSAVRDLLEAVGLGTRCGDPLASLTALDKFKLSLGCALARRPRLVAFTGPTETLAPADEARLLALLASVASRGLLVITPTRAEAPLHLFKSLVVLHQNQVAFHSAPGHLTHYFSLPDPRGLEACLARRPGEEWADLWAKHGDAYDRLLHAPATNLPSVPAPARGGLDPGRGAAAPLPGDDAARAEFMVRASAQIRDEIAKVIVGQHEVVEQLLIAVLAGGHCLLEGVPGLAKTALIRCLSQTLQLSFRRIQFTPDLMPSDITGTDIIQEDPLSGHRRFVFQKGPLFAQMLLADEINRTPAKTQAALLEAMQECSVTAGGQTLELEKPFFVLATQNPIEQEGTYPLPEAQKDRFLFHVLVGYPERDQERLVIERTTADYHPEVRAVLDAGQIRQCQQTARHVPVPPHVMEFVLDLVRNTRPDSAQTPPEMKQLISWGAGPRAGQCLVLAAKVRALLQGRFHVSLEDIEALAKPVLRHRIVPSFAAESEGLTPDALIDRLLAATPRAHASRPL